MGATITADTLIENAARSRAVGKTTANELSALDRRLEEIGKLYVPKMLAKWGEHVAKVETSQAQNNDDRLSHSFSDPGYFPEQGWTEKYLIGRFEAEGVLKRFGDIYPHIVMDGMDLDPSTLVAKILQPMTRAAAKLGLRVNFDVCIGHDTLAVFGQWRAPKYLHAIEGETTLDKRDRDFLVKHAA